MRISLDKPASLFRIRSLGAVQLAEGYSVDFLSPAKRSEHMARIRTKDTGPELIVRRILHRQGFRYRLHRKDLPGRPDIVLPKFRLVIFVHGCFWHQHEGCAKAKIPDTRRDFWGSKLANNVERDQRCRKLLEEAGWKVHVIWECQTKNNAALLGQLLDVIPKR